MITTEALKQINEKLEGIPVKGKNYVEVNTRVKAFRELCPEGMISTEIIEMADGVVTIKATIATEEGRIVSTGLAQEKESSSFINKTSYIENCETSAVGRALGFLGIGIDGSMCSADELATALNNQNKKPTTDKEMDDDLAKKITKNDVKIIEKMVEGKDALKTWVLQQCNVTKFEDMTNAQYGQAMRALNEHFEKKGK
jgi:hypothetical protein